MHFIAIFTIPTLSLCKVFHMLHNISLPFTLFFQGDGSGNPHVNRWAFKIDIMFAIYLNENKDHIGTYREIDYRSINVHVHKEILRTRNLKVHSIIDSLYWRCISL